MSWLQALFLGIVQGLTEFLPISSSGHLVVIGKFIGYEGENLTFAIAVHAATVLSIITVFGSEIWKIFIGITKIKWNDETQYFSKILLSMIPVAIIGLFFKKYVESIFGGNLYIVCFMLFVTGILLMITHYVKPHRKREMSFKDAFVIGIAQAIAIFPGLSRSGATISTGILLGNKKGNITQFSFLMVIIPILGEAFLDLVKGNFSFLHSGITPLSLLIGFLSAYISGTLACKWMLDNVRKGKLIYFAYYCIFAAMFVYAFQFLILNNV
jgi:undecaprenyl-diphosphatase